MGKIDSVHNVLVALDATCVSLEFSVEYQEGVTILSAFSDPGAGLFASDEYYEVFAETVVGPPVDHGSQATPSEHFVLWCGATRHIHIDITPKTHQTRFTEHWLLLSF